MFAIDRRMSLYGFQGRYEGFYSILYYLSLTLLSTQVGEKYKKVIVNFIILFGALHAMYGICQCFNWFNVITKKSPYYNEETHATAYKVVQWISGLTRNPNFFGSYIVLMISYSMGLFIDSKKIYQNIIYGAYISLFLFALLICNTTSAVVGLIFVLLFVLVYVIKNKLIKKAIALTVILVTITGVTVKFGKTDSLKDISTTSKETTEIAKGNADNSFGSGRIFIWKNTIKIVPDHLLHGTGIDCFTMAFHGNALTSIKKRGIILFDKAHNEYLQLLVTQGVFALLAYLALYGYSVFVGFKRSFKCKQIYLVLPILGYLVQAFFNISVIEVAPIFFMALGLCCGGSENLNKREGSKNQ